MKKVALLMTGQCRLLWLAAPSIYKYVIEPNNTDVFLYLNKDSMIPKVDNEEEIVKKVFNKNVKSLIFTDDNYVKELNELVESNYAKIDAHYKKFNRSKWDKKLNWHNSCQYLKLKKCAESAVDYANKNNFKYDLIVRCRPDIGWLNHFDLLRPISSDTLYVNHSLHHILDNHFAFWVEDTCFFGGQDVMHKFCTDFSEKMVDELTVCDERYDLSCATEKLLGRVLLNRGIPYTGINDYFDYKGSGWIRPKLSKYFVDWEKSPNYYLVEKFCAGIDSKNNSSLAVYFDRISDNNIFFDETIIK